MEYNEAADLGRKLEKENSKAVKSAPDAEEATPTKGSGDKSAKK